MNLSPLPIQKFFDNNGRPLVGGLLFTYVAGTSTKIATYTDSGGLSSNTNPIVLDFRGECRIWIDPSLTYKFVLSPADDTDPPTKPIWTVDNITVLGELAPQIIGKILWPLTEAESNAGFTEASINFGYPYFNLKRYNLVPNSPSAASVNSANLTLLADPTVDGPTGEHYFPNDSGSDVWYFDDFHQLRDGFWLNGNNTTLDCTATVSAANVYDAFLHGIYDVRIKNCKINMDISGSGATNSGLAFIFGSRVGIPFGDYPGGVFDQTDRIDEGLPPMGECYLENVQITTNCPNANCAVVGLFVGGLRGGGAKAVTMTGIGSSGPETGIYYEFGFATTNGFPATAAGYPHWSSSHATGLYFEDVEANDLKLNGHAIDLVEAYSAKCVNIRSNNCYGTFQFRIGEAHFYRPWVYDEDNVKKCITLENITSQNASGAACILNASQSAAGGYLSNANMALAGLPALTPSQLVDLMSFSLDGFSLNGGAAGTGLIVDGTATVSNGTAFGSFNNVNVSGEARSVTFNNCAFLDSVGDNFRCDNVPALFPNRRKFLRINGGRVCGADGVGLSLNWVQAGDINGVQIGYNTAFDAANEATQTTAVLCATDCRNVICTSVYATTSGGANAYSLASVSGSDESGGNAIVNPLGTATYSGKWRGVLQATNLTFTAAVPGDLAVTYSHRTFEYVRSVDGERVDYSLRLETSAFTHTTASGQMSITGLPYTVNAGSWARHPVSMTFQGITKAGFTQFTLETTPGATTMFGVACGTATAAAALAITDFPTGGSVAIRTSGHYFV